MTRKKGLDKSISFKLCGMSLFYGRQCDHKTLKKTTPDLY